MDRTDTTASKTRSKRSPALTPEARESELIALANDAAEELLRSGKASSQLICFYLKQGSIKSQLELEKLKEENKLLAAKTELIKSAKESDELYRKALEAMKSYSGHDEEPNE